MQMPIATVVAFLLLALGGCSTTSSSNVVAPTGTAWEGTVLVTQSSVPPGVDYKVIGSVEAEAHAGYDKATSLYPLLAAEAKKIGANAVVNAKGGRRVTPFSWSAAYVTGTAIKVADLRELKSLTGTYY